MLCECFNGSIKAWIHSNEIEIMLKGLENGMDN